MCHVNSDAPLTGWPSLYIQTHPLRVYRVYSDAPLMSCLRYSFRRTTYGLPSLLIQTQPLRVAFATLYKATRKGCACVIWEGKPKGCVCKIVRLLLAIAFSSVNLESIFNALLRVGVALQYKS